MTKEKTLLYVSADRDCPTTDLRHGVALRSDGTDWAVYDLTPRQRPNLYSRHPADSSKVYKGRYNNDRKKKRSALEMQRLHNLKRQDRVLSEPIHLPAIGKRLAPALPTYGLRKFAITPAPPTRGTPTSLASPRWCLGSCKNATDRSVDRVTVHKAVSYDMRDSRVKLQRQYGPRLDGITDLKASVRRQMERYRQWQDDQKRRQGQSGPGQGNQRDDDRLQCPSVSKEIVHRLPTYSKSNLHHADDKSIKLTLVETVAEETRCQAERVHRFGGKLRTLPVFPVLPTGVGNTGNCGDDMAIGPPELCVEKLQDKRIDTKAYCISALEEPDVCADDSELLATRPESPPAGIPDDVRMRKFSAKTWRTWRSANESDAYKDVQRYIEENDLMSAEKSSRIQEWMATVDSVSTGDKVIVDV